MSTLATCTSSTRPAEGADGSAVGDMLFETDTNRTIVCSNATGPVYKIFQPESFTGPYDLDGANSVTTTPLYHFDAALFDGEDAANNPSGGTDITNAVRWKCRATGGRHEAYQATAINQPTFETGGINGVPYVQLSYYDPTTNLDLTTLGLCDGDFTVFGITGPCTSGRCTLVGEGAGGGNRGMSNFVFGYTSGSEYIYFERTGAVNGTACIDYTAAGAHPVFYIRDSGTTKVYGDGNNHNSGLEGTGPESMFLCHIGGADPYGHTGPLYEVAVWDSVLAATDLNAIGAYAIAKYGAGNTTFDPTF